MKKLIAITIICLLLTMTACSSKSNNEINPVMTSGVSEPETTKPVPSTTSQPTTAVPTTVKPTEKPTDPPTEPIKDTSWKKEYIDFLNKLDNDIYAGYKLVLLDDDDIPELLAIGAGRVTPSYLCWVNDGELCEYNKMILQFYYFENENRFLIHSGFNPSSWDEIDKMAGNEITTVSEGVTVSLTGQESYKWNGEEMGSLSAYESALNSEFDTNNAKKADYLESYSEIIEQIKEY